MLKFSGVVLLFCAAIICVQCETAKEKAIALANECKSETGASDADIEAMLKHEPAEKTEGKCLRACVMKRLGIMSDDGKLIKEAAIAMTKLMAKGDSTKEELGIAVVEECSTIDVAEDDCDAAEELSECFRQHAVEKGLKFDEDE